MAVVSKYIDPKKKSKTTPTTSSDIRSNIKAATTSPVSGLAARNIASLSPTVGPTKLPFPTAKPVVASTPSPAPAMKYGNTAPTTFQGLKQSESLPTPTPLPPKIQQGQGTMAGMPMPIQGFPQAVPQEETLKQKLFGGLDKQPLVKGVKENVGGYIKKVKEGLTVAGTNKAIDDNVLKSVGADFYDGIPIETIREKYPQMKHFDDQQMKDMGADFYDGIPIDEIKKKHGDTIDFGNTALRNDHLVEGIDAVLDPIFNGLHDKLQSTKYSETDITNMYNKEGVMSAIPTGTTNALASTAQAGLGLLKFGKDLITKPEKTAKDAIKSTIAPIKYALSHDPLDTAEELVRFAANDPASVYMFVEGGVQGAKGLGNLGKGAKSIIKNEPVTITNAAGESMTMGRADLIKSTIQRISEKTGQGIGDMAGKTAEGAKSLFNKAGDSINAPGLKDVKNAAAEKILSSQRKLDKSIRREMEGKIGESGPKFALERDLVGKNIETTADNAGSYKIDKIKEKIDAVKAFGDTKTPDIARNVAEVIKKDIEKAVSSSYGKGKDILTTLNDGNPDLAGVYKLMDEIIKSEKIDYVKLEQLKELHDYLNPEGIRYDISGKPISETRNLLSSGKRSALQKILEDAGIERGVDIRSINKDIQGAHALERGLNNAMGRIQNNNIMGLGDTQTAMISAILGGAPAAVGGLFLKKGLGSEGLASRASRKLFTKSPKDAIPTAVRDSVTSTTPKSRMGRIMNYSDSGAPANGGLVVNKPTSTALVPLDKPTPLRGDVFVAGEKGGLKMAEQTSKGLVSKKTVREIDPQGKEYKQPDFNIAEYNKKANLADLEMAKKSGDKIEPRLIKEGDYTDIGVVEKVGYDGSGAGTKVYGVIDGKKVYVTDIKEAYRPGEKIQDVIDSTMSAPSEKRSKLEDMEMGVARKSQISYIEEQIGKKVSELDKNSKDIIYRLINNRKLQADETVMQSVFDMMREGQIDADTFSMINEHFDSILKDTKKPLGLSEKAKTPLIKNEQPVPTANKK